MFKHVTTILLSTLLLFTALPTLAATGPESVLKSTVEQLQNQIQAHHSEYEADRDKFYKLVNNKVVPLFDVPYISQIVLARYWRQATPQQRQEFQKAFTRMIVRSYADSLLENANSVQVDWKPTRTSDNGKRATVNTVLKRNDGQSYPIGFSMRLTGGQWKIYDITVNGLSLALNFRSQLSSEVRREGLDKVIDKMESGHKIVAQPPAK
jgi:ABC-type transport system involved in resistance to organic solvents, auxiliary component